MRLHLKSVIFASAILLGLAACNLPSSSPNNPAATMQAIATNQVATLQALQTQALTTATSFPTLGFPTLPPLNTPGTVTATVAPIATAVIGVKSATPVTYCNWAAYIKDVTIPDGTTLAPGTAFTKIWRLQNIGTCAWTTAYDLVFSSGHQMSGASSVDLPASVAPGQTVDISVNLRAPAAEGKYRGYWGLRSSSGSVFGIGGSANSAFYVDIKVVGSMTTVFNFATEYCHADWRSEAGDLGCPGNVGGKKGYAIQVDNPKLENGTTFKGIGLLTVPQRVFNGYLRGHYQAFTVRESDRFRAIINCEYQSSGCNAIFRLEYQIDDEAIKTFWQFVEAYEGQYYTVDLDLSSLAGKKVKFILTVHANGSADADKPLWIAPRIDRPSHLITPTPPTPTPTRTASPIATGTPTATLAVTATATIPPSLTPTPTPSATVETPTPSATATPTVTATETPTITLTPP